MGQHDEYGKAVLRRAVGEEFSDYGAEVAVSYCDGCNARIDGVIGKQIAVEIESRVPKQIRGALMDLICHPYPKKLLVILPVHMLNPNVTRMHCEAILRRFIAASDFQVVLLRGHGGTYALDDDATTVKAAISQLRRSSTANIASAGS